MLLLLVNVTILKLLFNLILVILFLIFVVVIISFKADKNRKKKNLKPILYKQIIEEDEIYCPAGKKLMGLIETLINQPSIVSHSQDNPESDSARRIREEGDTTSRVRYCLQCIEENIQYNEKSFRATSIELATTGDSLLWNHQVLKYLESFAPALKVITDAINTTFEEEYSEDSFERIRNLSVAYGMLYKYLNDLAIYCETAKGIAVDKAEMKLLSALLRGAGSQLSVMPRAAKRQLNNTPQDNCISINIPWKIDTILLAEIKAKAESHYNLWYINEDIRGNYKRVKKVEDSYLVNHCSKSLKSS